MNRGAKRGAICNPEAGDSCMLNVATQTANTQIPPVDVQILNSSVVLQQLLGTRIGWFIGMAGMYFVYFMGDTEEPP